MPRERWLFRDLSTAMFTTHVNRNRHLLEAALEFVLAGGFIDLTASGDSEPLDKQVMSIEDAVDLFLEKQIPLDHLTDCFALGRRMMAEGQLIAKGTFSP
jgi:hypothetical protein